MATNAAIGLIFIIAAIFIATLSKPLYAFPMAAIGIIIVVASLLGKDVNSG